VRSVYNPNFTEDANERAEVAQSREKKNQGVNQNMAGQLEGIKRPANDPRDPILDNTPNSTPALAESTEAYPHMK